MKKKKKFILITISVILFLIILFVCFVRFGNQYISHSIDNGTYKGYCKTLDGDIGIAVSVLDSCNYIKPK